MESLFFNSLFNFSIANIKKNGNVQLNCNFSGDVFGSYMEIKQKLHGKYTEVIQKLQEVTRS